MRVNRESHLGITFIAHPIFVKWHTRTHGELGFPVEDYERTARAPPLLMATLSLLPLPAFRSVNAPMITTNIWLRRAYKCLYTHEALITGTGTWLEPVILP
jgi:hypothetical protein